MSLGTDYENLLLQTYDFVVGIDEVGRGALAGPVMVGAYVFWESSVIVDNVNDSKKLTARARSKIFNAVPSSDYMVKAKDASFIDRYGIVNAITECINEIRLELLEKFRMLKYIFLIDGYFKNKFDFDYEYIKKGDSKVYSIAMASIVAKVVRDEFMKSIADVDDLYFWSQNKGYGAPKHLNALVTYGPSIHHRKSFINKYL